MTTMTPWKSSQTAPRDGRIILILCRGAVVPKVVRWENETGPHAPWGTGWYTHWDGEKLVGDIAYWMDCPKVPETLTEEL